jgi:ABC-type lipoprotein export system ATPase subunit
MALRGTPPGQRRERADELLDAVGLADRAGAFPAELSGGERQRAALCAAVAHRPALLLADEPTGELDEGSATAIRTLIVALARTGGTSVILVTHDLNTAEIADRTLRIRDGRVTGQRADGQESLVINGGWLQLPPDLLELGGFGRQAQVRLAADGVVVTPAGGDVVGRTPGPAAGDLPAPAVNGGKAARVEVCSVVRRFAGDRQVLDGLSHCFAPGRLTAVTGRSGAGKTTLLRLAAGLDRPSSGEVTLDGDRLDRLTSEQLADLRRRRIGYLAQGAAPIDFLSAHENVLLSLRIRGWDADAAARRAGQALAAAGLGDRAFQRVGRLSAGEAQRLALARALAAARGLLIVDEPTSSQDEPNARAVADLLAAAAHDEGQTVICASHDPAVISRADHVVSLDSGP